LIDQHLNLKLNSDGSKGIALSIAFIIKLGYYLSFVVVAVAFMYIILSERGKH
jgi:hypothetical protein